MATPRNWNGVRPTYRRHRWRAEIGVQSYSVQEDAKASEDFHDLVLTLYELKDHLDLSEVPPRGRRETPDGPGLPHLPQGDVPGS
jgi:hypothetical protein